MAMTPASDHRRRPFTTWVKKLNQKMKRTKGPNNPYPLSGRVGSRNPAAPSEQQQSQTTTTHEPTTSSSTCSGRLHSEEALDRPSMGTSARPSTEADGRPPTTAPSYGGTSLAGTNITATEPRRADSTFSSPAPSARSVATTLSTIQPMAHSRPPEVQYSQPQALVTAMPPSTNQERTRSAYRPATYSAIIANNLLTDNISILTLASSTQRRRRRSWDTDYDHASVRALPPASQFGGSRESLPLSVLSANLDGQQPTSPGLQQARSIAERSVSGIGGHGRTESLNGSIGGGTTTMTVPVVNEP